MLPSAEASAPPKPTAEGQPSARRGLVGAVGLIWCRRIRDTEEEALLLDLERAAVLFALHLCPLNKMTTQTNALM